MGGTMTLTVLMKAIILHWGGVAVLVINNSKLSKSQQIQNAPAPPPSFYVTIDLLSTVP